MDYPEHLHYTKDHEWLRAEADGKTAVIGITGFAQSELGDIVFVELEPAGTQVGQDDIFGTVEAVKTVSELYMPVSGTILAHNEALDGHPELINEDPYGEGWMVKIEMSSPDELDGLMNSGDYAEMVG
jgi:glycine cleavage system H protein